MATGEPIKALATLPAVYEILAHPRLAALAAKTDHALLVAEIQRRLAQHREALRADGGTPPDADAVAAEVAKIVEGWFEPRLKPVINLTGTLLHTNLGRAPLSEAAVAAMTAASGTVNLEYDLGRGKRGDRDTLIEELLCRLSGAEAATIVNNNAAAVYLTLNTLADRKRVAVSRGELVEIGDSFRIPDIVKKSGCKLMEVGTTNRTHPADYQRALEEGATVLLKVHASNYRIQGFTHEVSLVELVALGRKHNVPVVTDLGSGAFVDMRRWGLAGEPTVQESVAAGADVVTFSGDKLLGGPQAGLIAGRVEAIKRIKRNPMKRALRCDKLILAALEATLRAYLSPATIEQSLPAYRLIGRPLAEIERLMQDVLPPIERWAAGRAGVAVEPGRSQVGSGSLPDQTLETRIIALTPLRGSPETLAQALRELRPPVIGRVHGGKVLLDLRGLPDAQPLIEALAAAARP
ncbi:MAG: L-seryl-tRNA(Sec) selenium transferase [Candidatus Muproteobacteria bacterium RIFCSPLOWO2_01_FULL_60_18]|uniref:L-seryl-tRNA(Sec) selenium transferase n=1 Tax=Candidatus Muproteobacteria bacterium RIFCSPLOWO2_01_FULL_60_18 TaxID=1817768 RepID=A0A1F6TZA8_9PROT|nr:MAG: L-seryl-tRNA(Sec) selenium transferase [Candidatus Muproteobacteria bacterium RIFCSPLOWO2_01_FULL_60_18]